MKAGKGFDFNRSEGFQAPYAGAHSGSKGCFRFLQSRLACLQVLKFTTAVGFSHQFIAAYRFPVHSWPQYLWVWMQIFWAFHIKYCGQKFQRAQMHEPLHGNIATEMLLTCFFQLISPMLSYLVLALFGCKVSNPRKNCMFELRMVVVPQRVFDPWFWAKDKSCWDMNQSRACMFIMQKIRVHQECCRPNCHRVLFSQPEIGEQF